MKVVLWEQHLIDNRNDILEELNKRRQFAIDNGAEDVDINDDNIEIRTPIEMLENVRKNLEEFGVEIIKSELSKIPKTLLNVETNVAIQILKLLDKFEDLDDVQKVYTNADFSDQALEAYAQTI